MSWYPTQSSEATHPNHQPQPVAFHLQISFVGGRATSRLTVQGLILKPRLVDCQVTTTRLCAQAPTLTRTKVLTVSHRSSADPQDLLSEAATTDLTKNCNSRGTETTLVSRIYQPLSYLLHF